MDNMSGGEMARSEAEDHFDRMQNQIPRIELLEKTTNLLAVLKEIAEAKDIFLDPYNGIYFKDLVNKAKQAIANNLPDDLIYP